MQSMWRKVEALNRSYLKTGVAVLLATALSVWGIGEIPIHKMPFSAFWNNIAIRTISSLFWVLLIKIFYPGALARFTFRLDRKRLLIGLGIVAFLMVPRNLSHDLFNASLLQILEGFLNTKFNSGRVFFFQLFEENPNLILLKLCKVQSTSLCVETLEK